MKVILLFLKKLLNHEKVLSYNSVLNVPFFFKSLAKLTDGFRNSCCITESFHDLQHSSGSFNDTNLSQIYCDACSQTDIIGEVYYINLIYYIVFSEKKLSLLLKNWLVFYYIKIWFNQIKTVFHTCWCK